MAYEKFQFIEERKSMKLQIPNTSTVVDNPQLVDQSTVLFPDVGDTAAISAGQLPAGPVRAGTAWQQNPVLYPGGKMSWGGAQSFPSHSCPKPGSFDPTPATANKVVVNQDPPAAGKGQPITTTGATGSTGNPTTDLVRTVKGQVPNGPAFSNPS